MNILNKNIQISVLNQGKLNVGLVDFLTFLRLNEKRFNLDFQPFNETNKRPIEHNINSIQKRFLESNNDYLLLIDDDITPLKNPLDLVLLNKDIISCVVPTWKSNEIETDILFLSLIKKDDGYIQVPVSNRNGLMEVDVVSNGCLIVSRRVLEKVNPMSIRLFDKNGLQKLGHDFNFCEKAKKKGFKVWVNWDYVCDHNGILKTLELLKNYGK